MLSLATGQTSGLARLTILQGHLLQSEETEPSTLAQTAAASAHSALLAILNGKF